MNDKHLMIVDVSNIAHMIRHKQDDSLDVDDIISLTFHGMFMMLNKYYKKLKVDHVILAFDKPNWRKEYTLTSECVSGRVYKGDRNLNLAKKQKEILDRLKEELLGFEELITSTTGIYTMSADGCEADDIIAGVCQWYSDDNDITILSSDKDYMQLLTCPNIKLMNPLKEQYRTLEEFNYDVEWHLFFKAIRAGEDNIPSAFPRVRKTRLEKAYNDNFEMANLMETTWTDKDKREFKVGDLYKENRYLMDLTKQPDSIRATMKIAINEGFERGNKFSHFKFLKHCGQYQLKKIANNIGDFMPLLTNTN